MWFFLRMYRVLQTSMMGLSLKSYSGRLPKWGMMRNGDIFELQTQALHTDESDSLSWPTVVKSDADSGAIIGKDDTYYTTKTGMPRKINRNGKDGSVGLGRLVKLWGTPRATEWKDSDPMGSKSQQDMNAKMYLSGQVKQWATPQARDYRSGSNPDSGRIQRKIEQGWGVQDLNDQTGGKLNPDWVEILQGFPLGWTDISSPPHQENNTTGNHREPLSEPNTEQHE